MTRWNRLLAMLPLIAMGAAAQDDDTGPGLKQVLSEVQDHLKQGKVIGIGGAVMGPTVKNAPYSATEITESSQTLADGNRIHHTEQTMVYRDSEGRVRRETTNQITIWDPVAHTSYMLNPQTHTARKLPLTKAVFSTFGKNGAMSRVMTTIEAGGFATAAGIPAPPPGIPAPPPGGAPPPLGIQMVVRAGVMGNGFSYSYENGKPESLGQQMIEGVTAEGTRISSTIPAGQIGNDRPIQISSESWYSPELQTLVKSVHSDPRMGEDSFRLTNISRAEPPADLFQIPADYQMASPK